MPDLLPHSSQPELSCVVDQLTGSDPRVAEEAEAALVGWGPEAVPVLSEALARAPLVVRPRVVAVLRRRGGADSLAALEKATLLARHLQQQAAVPFQVSLIEAIEALGGTRSVHAFLRLLYVERREVQQHAVRALIGCGRAAIPGLCAALGSSHSSVRESAVEALGEVGDLTVIDVLHKALCDTRGYPRELATRAAVALGRVAERSPSLQLECVLPTLEMFTKEWTGHQLYRTSRWAKAKVEAALRKVRAAPIPSQAPAHLLRRLPLPSAESGPVSEADQQP